MLGGIVPPPPEDYLVMLLTSGKLHFPGVLVLASSHRNMPDVREEKKEGKERHPPPFSAVVRENNKGILRYNLNVLVCSSTIGYKYCQATLDLMKQNSPLPTKLATMP